ncbi:MAG: hypothetical protein AAFQ13_06690 [Pseudomonadota bacterium]
MTDKDDKDTDYKALGIAFMVLGVSMATTFGITLGWAFAPIGLTFFVLGIVYLSKAEKGE